MQIFRAHDEHRAGRVVDDSLADAAKGADAADAAAAHDD
jgi:hypothetical protein